MKTTIKSTGQMHAPVHPGEILREMYMNPGQISITMAAEALDVSRKHLSSIINGHAPITPDMAVRLAIVFNTEPDIWINMQAQHDLWAVKQRPQPKLRALYAA
jgi:addiction module HigA family antidote